MTVKVHENDLSLMDEIMAAINTAQLRAIDAAKDNGIEDSIAWDAINDEFKIIKGVIAHIAVFYRPRQKAKYRRYELSRVFRHRNIESNTSDRTELPFHQALVSVQGQA